MVHRLRELDVPLAEVVRILAAEGPGLREELLAGDLARLEAELDRTRAIVVSLRRLLGPDVERLDVPLRSVPARPSRRSPARSRSTRCTGWYDEAELDDRCRARALGPPGGRYADELCTTGRGEVLVHRPVADPRRRAGSRP